MEKCYEYFACSKTDCIMFKENNQKYCWDCEGTLCNHDKATISYFDRLNIDKCKLCLYYKHIERKIN